MVLTHYHQGWRHSNQHLGVGTTHPLVRTQNRQHPVTHVAYRVPLGLLPCKASPSSPTPSTIVAWNNAAVQAWPHHPPTPWAALQDL
jgi:hypothetical protein